MVATMELRTCSEEGCIPGNMPYSGEGEAYPALSRFAVSAYTLQYMLISRLSAEQSICSPVEDTRGLPSNLYVGGRSDLLYFVVLKGWRLTGTPTGEFGRRNTRKLEGERNCIQNLSRKE